MKAKEKREGLFARLLRPAELTSGTPWRVILAYSLPIMLSYLLQQIYVITDAVICGQILSAEQVAGVNDTYSLTFIVLQFAFGCTSGFSVITAGAVGRGDMRAARRSFMTQVYLTLGISAILTVLSIVFLPQLLGLVNVTGTNPEVYEAAYSYCVVIFMGIVAQMGYNFICGILRAYGDSVTPLVFLLISTALNIGLDILFLVPFGWGPAGAAAATILTQLISLIGCTVYTFLRYPDLRLRREDLKTDGASVRSHITQGIPLGLQFAILAIGIIAMSSAVVRFDLMDDGVMVPGTPAQNGYGAGVKLVNFLMAFFNGLGSAILGYNAQNYGRGDLRRVKSGTLQSLVMMLIISVICFAAGALLCIGGTYQYIFMSADKVSERSIYFGNTFVMIDISLYFILGFLIVVRAAVQGIMKVRFVLAAGTAELISRTLMCTFLPGIVNGAPTGATASSAAYIALCFGDPVAWVLASAALLIPLFGNIIREKP